MQSILIPIDNFTLYMLKDPIHLIPDFYAHPQFSKVYTSCTPLFQINQLLGNGNDKNREKSKKIKNASMKYAWRHLVRK